MSRSDFVSVTIVTYNSGRFIKRCLESVLDQNYPFKEIIVVDNNSTDGTIDILEPFDGREGAASFTTKKTSDSPQRRTRRSHFRTPNGS